MYNIHDAPQMTEPSATLRATPRSPDFIWERPGSFFISMPTLQPWAWLRGIHYRGVGGDQVPGQVNVESVLEKFSDTVYKVALSQTRNRADTEDVFQEVFLRLVRNKKEILSDEHMKAWLIRVTLNCCKKQFRSASRHKTSELTEEIPYIPPEELGLYHEVLALPEKYRIAIHLFYYEDMPVEEIARAIGTKSSTVKSHLFRGRQLLKEKLKGEYALSE